MFVVRSEWEGIGMLDASGSVFSYVWFVCAVRLRLTKLGGTSSVVHVLMLAPLVCIGWGITLPVPPRDMDSRLRRHFHGTSPVLRKGF